MFWCCSVVALVALFPEGSEAAGGSAWPSNMHASVTISKHPRIHTFDVPVTSDMAENLKAWMEGPLTEALEDEGRSAYTKGDSVHVRSLDEDGVLHAVCIPFFLFFSLFPPSFPSSTLLSPIIAVQPRRGNARIVA